MLGDSIQIAPAMPNSAHMANAPAKAAAVATAAKLSGWDLDPAPMLTNTCYSPVDARNAIHVASVHAGVAAEKTFSAVPDTGAVSVAPTEVEHACAEHWARTIWADTLG